MNDLNSLMHASVDGARPDVDRLLAGAMRDGQRLQRRRRISYAGAGLAVAAIASAGAVAVGSQSGSGTATDLVPAASGPADVTSSDPAALQPGQTFDLGRGVTGTVIACTSTRPSGEAGVSPDCVLPKDYYIPEASTIPGSGTGFAIVLGGPAQAVEDFWSDGGGATMTDQYHGITFAIPASSSLVQPVYQGQAVAIHVPGWKLVGEVGDDKQSLQGPHGAVADIVWRPASEHADWVSNPDKGANAGTWVSDVHDGIFVSIQAGQGTTAADIQALGASLTWQ